MHLRASCMRCDLTKDVNWRAKCTTEHSGPATRQAPATASCWACAPHTVLTLQLRLPQTEVGGEVVKILVENGTPVTPGMPIMIIKP